MQCINMLTIIAILWFFLSNGCHFLQQHQYGVVVHICTSTLQYPAVPCKLIGLQSALPEMTKQNDKTE